MKDKAVARLRSAAAWVREHWARLAFGAVLLYVFFGNAGFRGLVGNWRELNRLNREVAKLERDEKDLDAKLKNLRSGDRGAERLARRELGYIKKGEIEYRFEPPKKP